MKDYSTEWFNCPNPECDNSFEATIVKEKGGFNDKGWWVIQCDSCSTIFDTYVGKDVYDSHLDSGGEILERVEKDDNTTEDDVAEAVKRHQDKQ